VDVKTIAVNLPVTGDVTLEDFLEYLRQEPIDVVNLAVREVIVINKLPNPQLPHLWVGFLLSRRDQRVIPLMTIRDRTIEITAQELEAGTNKIDVNFFLINPVTQKGLYQTYQGSRPFSHFAHSLATKFISFRAIRGFNGEFTPREIIKEDSLDQWLERIERIQQIIYEYELVQDRVTRWDILSSEATSETVKLVYRKKNLNWRTIKESLKRFVERQATFKKFLIKAKAEDDLDQYFDLFENKQVVDRQEFDQYARDLRFTGEDLIGSLANSPNVRGLVRIYLKGHIRRLVDAAARR